MLDQFVRSRGFQIVVAVILLGAGLAAIARGVGLLGGQAAPASTPTAVITLAGSPVERLIPTATPSAVEAVSAWPSTGAPLLGTSTPEGNTDEFHSPTPSAGTETVATQLPNTVSLPTEGVRATSVPGGGLLYTPRERIGFVAPLQDVERYDTARLGAGWYISCQRGEDLAPEAGMECAQLVGSVGEVSASDTALLREIALQNPGRLWLVENEPDVIWQANQTPAEYARLYHDVYQAVKGADPTSKIAIGGISQVTPLRLRYLDEVMLAYERSYGEPIPVDVWNIHLAILREERGTWGVDIPPGMADDVGLLYEIEDNGNVDLLKGQVVAFRRWMAERDLREAPLIVSEFSVLMPPEYGFPFERVQAFMLAAFDFLMTATDEDLGCPSDGNRLVQRWAWYSLADNRYATGNLFDPDTGRITALGESYAAYAESGH